MIKDFQTFRVRGSNSEIEIFMLNFCPKYKHFCDIIFIINR